MLRKILIFVFLFSFFFVGGLSASASSFDENTPMDVLELEANKVNGISDNLEPVAVVSLVFSIGVYLIKRIAYS